MNVLWAERKTTSFNTSCHAAEQQRADVRMRLAAPPRRLRPRVATRALGNEQQGTNRQMEDLAGLGGDFGARDATAQELESGFNEKSLGNYDTDHVVKIPTGIEDVTDLSRRSCVVLDASDAPCDEKLKLVYQKQVIDWKIRVVDGHEVLRREFRTEGKEKAKELVTRLETVAECEGQRLDCFVEGPGARVEIYSRAVNGLHQNDFIMAAKLDKLDLSDVVVKKKPTTFLI